MSLTDGYQAYLRSPEWAEIRAARLARDNWRCTGCGDDGTQSRLEVHHLTYDRLGHERIEDLMTLCHPCHMREHGRAPYIGPVAGPTTDELSQRAALAARQREVLAAALRQRLPLHRRIAELEQAHLSILSRPLWALENELARRVKKSLSDPAILLTGDDPPSRSLKTGTLARTKADVTPNPPLSEQVRRIEEAHAAGVVDASVILEKVRRRVEAAEAKASLTATPLGERAKRLAA